HAQKEMIMGVLYTLFDTVREPPMILEQDEFAEATGDPEVHREKGGITKIKRNHEALTALIENPQALALFNPLMNAVIQDEATNALAREFWGIDQSANESGNAIEGKIESGSDKIAAYISALETFYAQRAAMRLRIYRDWGQTL